MPYDMIRENLENMFKERLKRLKERKKRKLPSKRQRVYDIYRLWTISVFMKTGELILESQIYSSHPILLQWWDTSWMELKLIKFLSLLTKSHSEMAEFLKNSSVLKKW